MAQEKKLLESRQQTELTKIKQTIEREKLEMQTKLRYIEISFIFIKLNLFNLRTDMLKDLNLEQHSNTNIQIRLLQMTHEHEEV
jgi:hypothetical protein